MAVVSIEASPSGDLMAVGAYNRKEQELDMVLMSTKDGRVIRNLTSASTRTRFEYIRTPGGFRNNGAVDVVGAVGRPHRLLRPHREGLEPHPSERRLAEDREAVRAEDRRPAGIAGHQPRRPGSRLAALSGAIGDIFILDVETGHVRNLTNDQFGDFSPTWAPDGKSIIYLARVSGNDKLFRFDVATGTKTQLTFGTHDDGGAQFVDPDTIVFPSTALDPNQPIDPEVARNGNIFNIWTLSLKNGRAEAVHRHADRQRVADRAEGREGRHQDRVRHLLQR